MLKKSRTVTGLGLAVCLVLISVVPGCQPPSPQQGSGSTAAASSVYERVLKTGKIRAAYVLIPNFVNKDPNTGKLSGIYVDALEEAAKDLNLTVEWVEEVGFATMIEGLKTDRYDMVGSGIWPNAQRGKYAEFSVPLCYSTMGVYVKSDDTRFTGKISSINSSSVRIATVDGSVQDTIIKKDFPNAQRVSLPESSETAQNLLDVTQNKADVTLQQPGTAAVFMKSYPGTVKNIAADSPISTYANSMLFAKNQFAFKTMIDTALEELINNGFVDQLIAKYSPSPGVYYPVARPFRSPLSNVPSTGHP